MDSRSDFSAAPVWFQWALHEIGIKETPGSRSTGRIAEYRSIAGLLSKADDGDLPWCAIFVNAALAAHKIPTSRSMAARSFERIPALFDKIGVPALGCIVTFWRNSPNSGLGHVGFYRGETATHIYTLGGNQGDAVSIAPFRRASPRFGFSNYLWPREYPLPENRSAIPIRAGMPLKDVSAV